MKNSWIALAMQSMTDQKWAAEMKKLDTPRDEITLYTLCKMYHRHCFIFTKAKSWCTIDTDIGLDEEELLDKCDIVLMFIETGVYGELKSRPYAPPPGHAFLQGTTADLPRPGTSLSSETKSGNGILDLTSTVELDTNCNTVANGSNTDPSSNNNTVNERQTDTSGEPAQKNIEDTSLNDKHEQSATPSVSMIKCIVNLTRLTDKEINMHSGREMSVVICGYNMRQ